MMQNIPKGRLLLILMKEQNNINDALDWVKKHRQGDVLTEKFIKMLHQKMFGKVWSWAGKFRQSGKNIGVEHHKIAIALRTLLDDVKYWIKEKIYTEDEIAARFHHRLVWIHLFPNGNGRHACLMPPVDSHIKSSQLSHWQGGNNQWYYFHSHGALSMA